MIFGVLKNNILDAIVNNITADSLDLYVSRYSLRIVSYSIDILIIFNFIGGYNIIISELIDMCSTSDNSVHKGWDKIDSNFVQMCPTFENFLYSKHWLWIDKTQSCSSSLEMVMGFDSFSA